MCVGVDIDGYMEFDLLYKSVGCVCEQQRVKNTVSVDVIF